MGSISKDPKKQDGVEYGGFHAKRRIRDSRINFLALARRTMKHLKDVGLSEIERLRRAPGGQAPTSTPETEQYDHDLRWVRLDNGQVLAVIMNTERNQRGYRDIAVLSSEQANFWLIGSRAERAIIAAVTVERLSEPINVSRLRKALALIRTPLTKSAEQHARDTMKEMRNNSDLIDNLPKWEEDNERALEFQHNLQGPSLDYVLALLRYKRPEFDTYPRKQQVDLIWRTCEHVNEMLESARKLAAFLEYGTPTGLPNKTVENRNMEVRAALLRDVVGLTYREIGEELYVPPRSPSFVRKGDHDTVRQMVKRGSEFLRGTLGEEGYREKVETMKADAARFNSLSNDEKAVERWAEYLGVSLDEARKHYRQLQQEDEEIRQRIEEDSGRS